MSASVSTESAREALRRAHDVRVVDAAEEGVAAADLPVGVYGFTSSPALASPMFSARRYRNFEVHRLANGPSVVGFVTALDAATLLDITSDVVQIQLYPDAEDAASTIVAIGYDRIVHHRQYSVLNAETLTLHVSRTAHVVGA